MARYLPSLNALRAFEAAGRLGGFSRAAEELSVSHAAVSRHVHALESQLGTALFARAPRGVRLTEAGRDYLARVSPALETISRASVAVRAIQGSGVSVSCEPTFAMKWLMPRLGEFEAAQPAVDITLHSTPGLADVAGGEVDMAIRYSRQPPEAVSFDLISDLPVYPYAAPGYTEATDPRDLLRLRLLHEDDGTLWRQWFAVAGIADAVLPRKPKLFSSLLAIEGALSGQGIVLTSAELAENDVRDGRLVRLSPVGLAFGAYRLLHRPEAIRRRPLRQFRDWLIAATREFRPRGDPSG